MNYTTMRTLGVLALCVALASCGSDGETTESTGVDTSTGTGGGSGGGGGNPGRLQFGAPSITVSEGAANAVITVTRTDGTNGAVSVTVATSNGSATQPQDYTAVNTTVTFAAGDAAAKTLSIPVVNDTTAESGETLTVTLSAPTGNATLGSATQVLITITDDDVAVPAAPKAALSSAYKRLTIDWTAAPGATSYRLMKDETGGGTFTQVGTDLPASARSTDVSVVVHNESWGNTRYAVAACNSAGCTQSPAVTAAADLSVPMIGYLKSPAALSYSYFGSAVALSADGNTLAVGVDQTTDTVTPYAGFVLVYTRSGNDWTGPVTLKATNADNNDDFGNSLALSADGNTLVIGAPSEASGNGMPQDNSVAGAGAAYVFTRPAGGPWTQTAYLKSAEVPLAYERFGFSVAVSPDGTVAAAGVPYRTVSSGPVSSAGVAYLFTLSAGTWSRTGPITAPTPTSFAYFGTSIALSNQGTLVVGASQQDVGALQSAGSAFVYTNTGGSWTHSQTIAPDVPVEYGYFGTTMSIAHDGSRLAIGSPNQDLLPATPGDPTLSSVGVVYLFDLSAGGATQTARLLPSNPGEYNYFGSSVALSGDGGTLAVGSEGEDSGGAGVNPAFDESHPSAGAAYLFTQSGASWSQRSYLKAPNPQTSDLFGSSVAVSSDGNVLAVGSPYEDSGAIGFNGNQLDDCQQGSVNCAEDSGAIYLY